MRFYALQFAVNVFSQTDLLNQQKYILTAPPPLFWAEFRLKEGQLMWNILIAEKKKTRSCLPSHFAYSNDKSFHQSMYKKTL